MARGKHKVRSTNQRSNHNEAVISQLTDELAMETVALSEAATTLKQIAALQKDLASEHASLQNEALPYAEQLRGERDYLRAVFASARSHHSRITDAWSRYTGTAIDNAPGSTGLEQVESLKSTLGFGDGFIDNQAHLKMKDPNVEVVTRLQRARGQRRNVAQASTPEQRKVQTLGVVLDQEAIGDAMIRPGYRRLLLDEGIVFVGEDGTHQIRVPETLSEDQRHLRIQALTVGEGVWNSRASDLDADGVHVWGPGNMLSSGGTPGVPRLLLGVTAEPEIGNTYFAPAITAGIPLPLPSTPAANRNSLSQQTAEGVLIAWRSVFESRRLIAEGMGILSHPFAPLAHHPHPGQGLALQNAYARAAFSRWIHHGAGSTYAHSAIGLTSAATYWLPAGQTASFAESEPMEEADRAEMVLPFPQIFLAFAEPLVLEKTSTATAQTEEAWRVLSEISHDILRENGTAGHAVESRLSRGGTDILELPSIDEMISQRGALIEGVLLLADSLGRPDERFAWCLTIPGAYGSTLGRFVVPAQRSATEYRDVIDNLTAVVAWAQWHEPDQNTEVPLGVSGVALKEYVSTPDFQRNAKRAGAGIRVIDVKSTYRGAGSRTSRESGEPNHNVSPHIRRGHWRRQRFGQGLEQSKRIRIAPVLVNAHRGDIAHRVYRLRPTPKSGH
jgi:hypothetical protein